MPHTHVAIITGAGSGIGQATALALHNEGYCVALVGRDRKKLEATQNRLIGGASSTALIIEADLAKPESANLIAESVLQKWGRVDALINNAAMILTGSIEAMTWPALEGAFAANTFGPACLIARLWPTFVSQKAGRIVNVSSMATIDPLPGLAIYAASKAALECLTLSINKEGHPHGIRGFSVLPGAVETPMLREVVSAKNLPTHRTLNPIDVGRLIAECAIGRRDKQSGKPIILPSP